MLKEFKVTVEMPAQVTVKEMTKYIENAVKRMCGLYDRAEPLFMLDRDSVKVNRQYKRKG